MNEEKIRFNDHQKSMMVIFVLSSIPMQFTQVVKVIPYFRLAISEAGGKNITDEEAWELFEKLKPFNVISVEDNHIRRTIQLPNIQVRF